VFHIVGIQYPVRASGRAETLAFNHELLAAPEGVGLVAIKVDPLEVRTLAFSAGASFIVGVRLVVAFLRRGYLLFRVKLPRCPQEKEVETTV